MFSANALVVLGIIDKILALALEAAQNMPEAEKAAFWKRHEDRLVFWQGIFDRFQKEPAPAPAKP